MNELRKQINFAVACVSDFAKKHGLSMQESFCYLYTYNGIEFLKEHYDIENTLPFEDVLEDILIVCRNNSGIL